jgi:hypothetical protein
VRNCAGDLRPADDHRGRRARPGAADRRPLAADASVPRAAHAATTVALTAEPAGIGLRPATIIAGDFRRGEVRRLWHNLTPSRALFERAAEHVARRRYGDWIYLADLAAVLPGVAPRDHIGEWRGGHSTVVDGRRVEIEYSAPYSGVLSVR